MKRTDCIDDFLMEQLECFLPWSKTKIQRNDWEVCSGNLTNFRAVHTNTTSEENLKKLKLKGCLKPNCFQTYWKKSYVSYGNGDPNCTRLSFGLLSDAYTIKHREILLADFSTFVVDCGSYLGLFLGASILSITDNALIFICKAGRRVKESIFKCR